jgi:hypothetical protein
MQHRFYFAAALFAGGLSLSPAVARAQAGGKTANGTEFDLKTTMNVSGGMGAMLGGMSPGYSGHGVALGGRLRIDIVDGAIPPLADKGDYLLFDTTGMTVVHPAKKEYVVIPRDFSSKALEQMQSMGMSISVSGVSAVLDSVPGVDTVAGLPTRHYRTKVSYTMTVEGMGASQQVKNETTSDYWTATVPGLDLSPLQRANQFGGAQGLGSISPTGPLKDLAAKLDSLGRKVSGSAVRMKTTTATESGAAGGMNLDMSSEMSKLKRAPIDESVFAIPAGFSRGESPFPGN